MADVNWTKYRCSICLMLGLIASAVVSGLLGWLLIRAGVPIVLAILVFFAIWAVLGFVVDRQCHGRSVPATAATIPAAAGSTVETAAAEAAAAERRAAAAAAEAERRAGEAAREAEAARAAAAGPPEEADRDGDGAVEGADEGTRPAALDGPRGGKADDLKKIKGIGPKLEELCNQLGFYHFDQIANWTADEVAWVDSNLEGFRGRVTRDEWVAQARALAAGGTTDN